MERLLGITLIIGGLSVGVIMSYVLVTARQAGAMTLASMMVTAVVVIALLIFPQLILGIYILLRTR